jgi:hypothetical protein
MVGGGEVIMAPPGGAGSTLPSCGIGLVIVVITVGGPCGLFAECVSGTTTGTYTILGLAGTGSMGIFTTSVSWYVTLESPASMTHTRNVEELLKFGNAGIVSFGARRCATIVPFTNPASSVEIRALCSFITPYAEVISARCSRPLTVPRTCTLHIIERTRPRTWYGKSCNDVALGIIQAIVWGCHA